MHFATKFVVAAAAMAAGVSAQLTVASPAALIQCQPISLSWSGSTAGGPFFVALLPGGQASAAPLEDLGEIESSPYSWTVNLPAGTEVTIRVIDQSGEPQYSDPITIQDSQSTACLSGGASSASGSASASDASASPTGSMSGSMTPSGSMSGSMTGSMSGSMSGSASPTGSGAAATSSPNAGSSVVVGSLTGLAGLVVAALGVVA